MTVSCTSKFERRPAAVRRIGTPYFEYITPRRYFQRQRGVLYCDGHEGDHDGERQAASTNKRARRVGPVRLYTRDASSAVAADDHTLLPILACHRSAPGPVLALNPLLYTTLKHAAHEEGSQIHQIPGGMSAPPDSPQDAF